MGNSYEAYANGAAELVEASLRKAESLEALGRVGLAAEETEQSEVFIDDNIVLGYN